MTISRCDNVLILLGIFFLGFSSISNAQNNSHFDGFFADLGVGYRNVNTSSSSSLTLNGSAIPSSLNTEQPSSTVTALTAGYNLRVTPGYILALGANISPASGQAQQVQIQALNQTIALAGIKPLYNYGFFIAPGLELGEGLAYLKVGTQTQVNNSNTSPNFYGYLIGMGYKHIVYESIYVFGEADYAAYSSQTTNKSVSSSGRMINATVTSTPQGSRFLLGVGISFD